MKHILKNKKVMLGLCFYLSIFYMMTGCTMVKKYKLESTVVKEDLPENSKKGYVSFEFPSSKTSGEAVFDVGVKVVMAALSGGGQQNEDKLEVSKKTLKENGEENILFWIRTYQLENMVMYGPEYNYRWVAELPGTYTYQIAFLERVFEVPLCYIYDNKTIFCDVTVDVKKNMITPVKVYYLDFYDEHGNPKKADSAQGDASDTPNLDIGGEQIFADERFHIGEPYPVSDEKIEQFLDDKEE